MYFTNDYLIREIRENNMSEVRHRPQPARDSLIIKGSFLVYQYSFVHFRRNN